MTLGLAIRTGVHPARILVRYQLTAGQLQQHLLVLSGCKCLPVRLAEGTPRY